MVDGSTNRRKSMNLDVPTKGNERYSKVIMDLKPHLVSGRKEASKTSSTKEHLESSSSVRPSTLRCADVKAHPGALENRFDYKTNSKSVTRTIRKCTGFELTLKPAPPVSAGESRGAPAPLGKQVLLYAAESFQSTDSSLASLSSLIQNVVGSSHGAIMKPLSSVPGVSSSTMHHSPPELVTHLLPANNGALRRSAASALPVLSSQLCAGKPVLIPFHISHMNYLNDVTKYPSLPSSLMPTTSTSTLKPAEPCVSLPQPIKQRPLSQLYHTWSSTAYGNGPASEAATRLSHLHKTSCISSITNTNGRKSQGRLPSSLSSPRATRLEAKGCPKSKAIKCHSLILPKKPPSNASNRFSPTRSTTITLATDYLPPENGVTKNPQKKILTSLLSGKTQSQSLLAVENFHGSQNLVNGSQNLVNEAALGGKCSAFGTLPYTACASTFRGCEGSEPSVAKRKRLDKCGVRLVCSNCDLMFFSGTDLLVHRYEQHGHVCGECDGRFLSVARLNQHKESDHPVMMICSLCRFHTFSKQGLIDHQRLEHRLEIDSAGDSNTASRKIIKASSPNLTNDILSHSSEMKHTCDIQTSGSENESPAFSIAITKTHESSDLPEVSVNTTISPDTLEIKNGNRGLSSPILKGDCQLQLKPNGPVFTSFANEPIIRKSPDVEPACANFDSREHGSWDIVPDGAEQHFSESDEPKLVIDTDKCRRIRNSVGNERKISHPDTKVEIYLGKCQAQRRNPKSCLIDRRIQNESNRLKVHEMETSLLRHDHNKDYNGLNSSVSVNEKIGDSMTNASEPVNILLPDDAREKLQTNVKQSPVVFDGRKTIATNCTREKSTSDSPRDGDSNNSDAELCNGEMNDKYLILIKALSSGKSIDVYHTGLVPSGETCGGDGAKQPNARSPTHCSELENKLHHRASDSCAISQSSSRTVTADETHVPTGHDIPQPLAQKEKFLPLLERHALSSLPPKKRKIFSRYVQTDLWVPDQLTDSNPRGTDTVAQQDIDSMKIQDSSIQRTQSVNETVASTVERILSTTSCQSLQPHQPIDRRYLCPVSNCVASFSRKWNLDGHINKVHAKFATVPCSVPGCQKAFPSKRDLRQHVTVDHKGKSRKFQCCWPECNKSFFARTHLRIHTLTHTGEKPVACGVCDYRCRQRTALMWHMRKHGVFHRS